MRRAAISDAQEPRTRYSDRIVRDPQVCGGQAVFKGTRVTLRTVLASLADGDSIEEILEAFPTLKPITWLGRPGVHLQVKTKLTAGAWTDLPGTDAQNATNYPVGAGASYFRLINPF